MMILGAPKTTVVLKVGDRDMTNGHGSHAGDDHSEWQWAGQGW